MAEPVVVTPGEDVVEVRGLRKGFDGVPVLEGVNFSVRRGETMAIIGSSGCGKSTVLRHLIGAYRPDAGSVRVLGTEMASAPDDERNKVRVRFGTLFQTGALYNSMSVGENVALPLREHTQLDEKIIGIIVKMKLELVGLRGFEHLKPSQVSGGMAKRVGLARAIVLDPEILFYDEPTTGLDPITAGVINKLIMDLSKKLGVTSVVVTQDMNCAFTVADRVTMLFRGKVQAVDTPEAIRRSADPVVRQFVRGEPDGPIPLQRSSRDYAEDLLGSAVRGAGRPRPES